MTILNQIKATNAFFTQQYIFLSLSPPCFSLASASISFCISLAMSLSSAIADVLNFHLESLPSNFNPVLLQLLIESSMFSEDRPKSVMNSTSTLSAFPVRVSILVQTFKIRDKYLRFFNESFELSIAINLMKNRS
ncbi:uncharacterized protein DS421_6g192240 [Arachis hypogaea]|nr:uncharacterized protein DS421_6g192240 [Arachis hypogaea]